MESLRAHGGITSGLTVVGENGPELLDAPAGSNVIPAGTTRSMLSGGGGGGGELTLKIESGGSAMDDLLVEIIRKAVRVVGGGNVQRALGS